MSDIKRKVRVKIGVFYYDTETDQDVEYNKIYDVNCEHHGAFSEVMDELVKEGTLPLMDKLFGDPEGCGFSKFTDLTDKYYFTEELYVHTPTSEERFEEMCRKWEAIFKQKGII